MKKIISAILALAAISSFAVCAQARSLGDVDKNGQVNSNDALLILSYSVGMPTNIDTKLADTDLNGTINSTDALMVLKTAVGALDEIKDIEKPVCKTAYIDPIIKSGKFSLKMGSIAYNSETVVINGADAADVVDTKWFVEIALYKNGKNYLVLPEHKKYAELPEKNDIGKNVKSYLTNLTFVGTTLGTMKNKTYRCEVFKNSSGCTCKFYFDGTKWEYFTVTGEDGKSIMAAQVLDFNGTVNQNFFSLNGYEKVDVDALDEYMMSLIK